jgi:uncharacterized protein YbgA (DUF1722 family)/uncharacterized protein YbbK (DUF523 family)
MSTSASNPAPFPSRPSAERIRIGISSCLLGEKVRWDGDHKRDGYIAGTLAAHFDLVPVCPEVAIGLGVPREPIRLVGPPGAPRAMAVNGMDMSDPARDFTEALAEYGRRMARELDGISGYLFKSGSPSCGMERVKVHGRRGGMPAQSGTGIYARAFMAACPLLPAQEEGRLNDPVLRDHFVERVCAYHRWQRLLREGLTSGRLLDFHDRHRLALMAHGARPARRLGRLAAGAGRRDPPALAAEYGAAFMAVLARKATRRSHANVLVHAMVRLKRTLDRGDEAELAEVIERYRKGLLPLIVPVTLLQHHLRRHPDPDLAGQTYLDPHPAELMLRNRV